MSLKTPPAMVEAAALYVDLLKRCVCNLIYQDAAIRFPWDTSSDEVYLPFDRPSARPRRTGRARPTR